MRGGFSAELDKTFPGGLFDVCEHAFGKMSHPVHSLAGHVFKHVFWRTSSSRPRLPAVFAGCCRGVWVAGHG